MFTLSLLYVVFYLFIFLAILVLTFSQMPLYILTHFSTTNVLLFIQKYKPTKNLYLWLFFSLTGLPPVGLFFIKFNIFFFVLYQAHVFVIIVLFLLFFLNMLYYMQLFNFRNFKKSLYNVLTPDIIAHWTNTSFSGIYSTYNTYKFTLMVVNILLFIVLAVIFFSDYFLILNVL